MTKSEMTEMCDDLLDLLEDIVAECHEAGCVLSADVCERIDYFLEPEEVPDEEAIEVKPVKP